MKKKTIVLIFFIVMTIKGMGHPMPHSVLSLRVNSNDIDAVLKIPIRELQLAIPFDVNNHPETLLQNHRQQLSDYILEHTHPRSINGQLWKVAVRDFTITKTAQASTGEYQELTVLLSLIPPPGASTRNFNLYYDGILHQVVTHKVFVTLQQDWKNGITAGQENELGVIELDIASNNIRPLSINLDEGSLLKGFKAMVWLGIHHIAAGIDHLLFLLVLLLPAPLIADNGRWTKFGGTRYSLVRLIKIATAFTIGHSISLILGSLRWLVLPQQPVEIAIAATILITAIHALRPVFPNREIYVARGFGLIHGLAFSTVISDLNLSATELTFSILGFNIGIEIMQVFVILITMPWLILLCKNHQYSGLRITGALFALAASLAWMAERITGEPNWFSNLIVLLATQGRWLVLLLAVWALCSNFLIKRKHVENLDKT